jgi:Uma2 family endonuclease
MSEVPAQSISRGEYLRRERRAEFRSEYHRGHVVARAGATRNHNQIVMNISIAIGVQLRGRPCSNYANDMRVSVQEGERYLYPDIVVTCGQQLFEDDERDTLVNPLVVMEVLSPSTEVYDRGEKFLHYQTIPSPCEYVLVSQKPRRIEVYRKQPDGLWIYQSWAPAQSPVNLPAIDCTLALDEVYDKFEEVVA